MYIITTAFFSFTTELLEALFSLPPIVTTDISLLPNNSISSSSGSHHPATLHQITNNSSGGTDSTPVISTPIASQPTQSIHTLSFCVQACLQVV